MHERKWSCPLVAVLVVLFLALAAAPRYTEGAEATPRALVRFVDISPPLPGDIMNDEVPHLVVLGDDLVACWESDYTHWSDPDGNPPSEDPVNEDAQVRILHNGTWGPVFNVSTQGLAVPGYGHHTRMAVHDGRLYVLWNSHTWSPNNAYSVFMRTYDPSTGSWGDVVRVVDTPDNGLDAGGSATSHDGKLWIAWQSVRRGADNISVEGLEVRARWFDGSTWGPVLDVSQDALGPDTEPSIVSVDGVLHVAWMHDDHEHPGNADIHWSRLLPNGTFSAPRTELGFGETHNDKKVKLVRWGSSTVMVWQSDGIDPRGRVYSDVVLRVLSDGVWGAAVQLNPVGRYAGNVQPDAVDLGGRLYIAWASNDDALAVGTDMDVVMRDYDGQRLGDIVAISPAEDTTREGRPSDDGSVSLAVYNGLLYAAFDTIYSPEADGLDKDVLLRYIGYDLDGDGVDDNDDAFPEDPDESVDSDGDGHGDDSDAYPTDPTRWEVLPDGNGNGQQISTIVWAGAGAVLAGFALSSFGYMVMLRSRRRGRGTGGATRPRATMPSEAPLEREDHAGPDPEGSTGTADGLPGTGPDPEDMTEGDLDEEGPYTEGVAPTVTRTPPQTPGEGPKP